MLRIDWVRRELTKLHPLAISRGTSYGSVNLFVRITDGTHTGIGEAAPGAGYDDSLAPLAESQLGSLFASGELPANANPFTTYRLLRETEVATPAIAAVDTALWDLLAKQANVPLHRLLGLPCHVAPTSVTVGLNPPEVTRERTRELLERTGGRSLKVKLGSPQGIDHDQAHFVAALEAATPFGVKIRVDANGGWSVEDAQRMIGWLADRGVDYIEQPLVQGNEDGLPHLQPSPLPIFADESCRFSSDIPKWASHVQGINLKLMKCGGITEALRIAAVARAHGLQTMIGCMGESSVAIAAGTAIGALFDYLDLDSHLNLNPDPARGLRWEDGCVVPSESPGHGAELVTGTVPT